jgi:hypothetical protein
MADAALQLRPRHLRELRRLLAAYLTNEEVWAYDRRMQGTALPPNDLALVVRHPGDLQAQQGPAFRALKEALHESSLPLRVELLDWATLPPSFHRHILESHTVLHTPEHLESARS